MARKTNKPAEVIARESIADKIAKVMAKAESTNSAEEAATFLAKAHQMMADHQISFLDLAQLDQEDPLGHEPSALTYWKSENWVGVMANALAQYYGLSAIRITEGNQHHLLVIGRESARETFKAMGPFIKKEVHRLAREEAKRTRTASQWATEIGKALSIRLAQMTEENRKSEESRVQEGGFALVPFDEIDALKEKLFPSGLKEGKSRKVRISARAKEVAEGINLSAQIMEEASENPFLLAAE
jgi:hypothetical protein